MQRKGKYFTSISVDDNLSEVVDAILLSWGLLSVYLILGSLSVRKLDCFLLFAQSSP